MKYKIIYILLSVILVEGSLTYSSAFVSKKNSFFPVIDSIKPIVKITNEFQYKNASFKNHISIKIKVLDGSNNKIPLSDCTWSLWDFSKKRILSSSMNNIGEASIDIPDIESVAILRIANLYYNTGTDINLNDYKGSSIKIDVVLYKNIVKFDNK